MAGIDRISPLPDDVLVHILSFLPTKISVSTGILSKRWSFLWADVPNLDFDSYDYAAVSFKNIVNGVMAKHRGQNIRTFRLHLKEYDCTDSEVERWIAIVVDRNVRKLDILLDYQVLLPQFIYTCKTLVDLRLSCCGNIPTTSDVSLPSLKKLSFGMVNYESDDSLAHMLSGCPVLEELIVVSANFMNMMVWCCISSPTLKRLVLEAEFNEFEDEVFRVKIDTPALRYIKIHDRLSRNVSAGCLPYLNEADIFFADKEEMEVESLDFYNVLEFIGKLYNVKRLTLSTGWMKVCGCVFSNLNTIKLNNLKELHLDADGRFITNFLEIADNLRSLTISIGHENLYHWMEPKQVPTCLVSHLGTVRINGFRCTQRAFNMVRYILRNSKVLKQIEIYFRIYGSDLKERSEARGIISLFERGSESCQLSFPGSP